MAGELLELLRIAGRVAADCISNLCYPASDRAGSGDIFTGTAIVRLRGVSR